MWIEIRYFAGARDAAGCSSEKFECATGVTVAELRRLLHADRPRLERLLATCRFALGDDFAFDRDVVGDGAVVYVMPPVSGGAGQGVPTATHCRAELVERRVDVGEASRRVQTGGAGAIATFCGVVRDHSKGQKVICLDYEAHAPLAVKEMARIANEAVTKHGLVDAFVIHRVGHLEIGDVAVDIAASSAHRAEAFAGCRHIIEELKKSVPIWKRETGEDGAEWVSQGP